jgi:hypothetical protein
MTDDQTEIVATTPPSYWSQTGEQLLLQSLDPVNGNKILMPNDMLVYVVNNSGVTTGTSPLSIKFTSQPDSETGRSGDIDEDLEPGDVRIFRFTKRGWADSEGYLILPAGQSEDILVGAVTLR